MADHCSEEDKDDEIVELEGTAVIDRGLSSDGERPRSFVDPALKIQRTSNGQVVFALSGRIDEEHVAQLETYIRAEANAQSIVLDLNHSV